MAKKKKTAAAPSETVIVQSKCKEALKAHDVNVASDALEGLNEVCHWYIQQAAARAAANGRKTVRKHDFLCMG